MSFGFDEGSKLAGGMGIQDVTLIRHAYVCMAKRKPGIGSMLLGELRQRTTWPVLIRTRATADWAILLL
jgi:hypothetical protein